jgi:ribosomal protein L11 methyltransferase
MATSYCITCTCEASQSDIVVALLGSQGVMGCEESVKQGVATIRGYFAGSAIATAAETKIKKTGLVESMSVSPVVDQDWNAKWRESMKPAHLGQGLWVSPSWLAPPPDQTRHWIRIEPKMAFGTGHHETTRLAAMALVKTCACAAAPPAVLDIGCGSGVLCFVADLCGARLCMGVEIDGNCRENLAENRDQNSARGTVGFIIGDCNALNSAARVDCVVMNMIRAESEPLLDKTRILLGKKGRLIWSGILLEEKNEAIASAKGAGFALVGESFENEWWCGEFG